MNKAFIFIIIFSFSSLSLLHSQDFEDDAALWLTINLEKKINDNFEIRLKQRNRINNNFSEYGMGYLDIGAGYNFNSNIKLLCEYVYRKNRQLNGSYETEHRGYLALIIKKEINRFTVSYRNMVRFQLEKMYKGYENITPEFFDRNKLTVKYDITKRVASYVSGEIYVPFYGTKEVLLIDRFRTALGTTYKLTKKDDLDFYFMYQQRLNESRATRRDFIYGITFTHQF